MMEWIKTDERKPEAQKMVFITAHEEKYNHSYTTTAQYIPPKTVLSEDFLNDEYSEGCEEYDEENDCYWVLEGWFEYQTIPDVSWKIDDTVTHWMELPRPAKE